MIAGGELEIARDELPLAPFFFDCLHADGRVVWMLVTGSAVPSGTGGSRLAVLHASQVDLDRLQALVNDLVAAERDDDGDRYSMVDEQFHLAIASATSNPLMVWLYEQINVIRTHSLWAEMRKKIITQENMRLYNVQHAAVVRAIQARDAAGAAETMVRHMDKARNDLIGAHSR